jgi:hypothetical protein
LAQLTRASIWRPPHRERRQQIAPVLHLDAEFPLIEVAFGVVDAAGAARPLDRRDEIGL